VNQAIVEIQELNVMVDFHHTKIRYLVRKLEKLDKTLIRVAEDLEKIGKSLERIGDELNPVDKCDQ
jgi:hypothetical protein